MPQSLQQLLPAPDDAVRCAEHARSIGIDPAGTAIRADRVVVVCVPLPWPKPALDHPHLTGIRDALTSSIIPTRLLAAVPEERAADPTPGVEVSVYDRQGGSARLRRHVLPTTDHLPALGQALAGSGPDAEYLVAEVEPAPPAVLICTQGSHDVCCGSDGVRLADELDSLDRVTVHRVSHTGGHRFAPTAMTLPDGRMWADLDLDRVRHILAAPALDEAAAGSATVDPDLVACCRGWWGADTGPAQVAERAVFAAQGWSLDRLDRQAEVVPSDPVGGPAGAGAQHEAAPPVTVVVTAGRRRWEVDVVEGRAVPSIACRQPGGLPAKPGREYQVVDVRPDQPEG